MAAAITSNAPWPKRRAMDAVILAGRQTTRNRTLTSPCSIDRRKADVLITVRHRTEALRCRETPQNTDTSKRTAAKSSPAANRRACLFWRRYGKNRTLLAWNWSEPA
jgi:hypothetical protein